MIATDGSTFGTGTTAVQAGARVFYQEGEPQNQSLWLPPILPQTNQAAKVTAIKAAAEDNNRIQNLYIKSNSKHAINALIKNLAQYEDQGYIGMANAEILQATTATLWNKKGKTMLKWVKGHSHKSNEGADQMANLDAQKNDSDEVDLTIHPTLWLTGAKLSKLT